MSVWIKIFGEPAEKPDWRLCGQNDSRYYIQYKDQITGIEREHKRQDGCVLTYFLYENQFGERKFKLLDSEEGDLEVSSLPRDHYAYRNKDYRDKIRPWLDGRYDPDFTAYETIPKDDFQNRLAKKKVK